MHIKLRDKLKTFKTSMDVNAVYFEFSDGFRIAMDKSLYVNDTVYRKMIDTLISDNRVRHMTKF